MSHFSARLILRFFVLLFVVLTVFHQTSGVIYAQNPATPSAAPAGFDPTSPDAGDQWQFDRTVTSIGRNADRARQLLWWVWSHPGIHSAPVLAEVWARTRNMVYVFIVFVIVAFGLGLILSRSKGPLGPVFSGISSPLLGINIPTVMMRLGVILLYVTFSYVIVLGLIQLSEISMQFIKSLIGQDLFNVFFAGAGNNEQNYTTFIGYRNTNPLADEMVQTSLFVINFTSLTYYAMSIILILRTVILWFMLVLSPFLALLMPFVFIRNVGWIWIGVFFQWLFYGPLMVLFVVTIVKIWVAGIPYPFDFSRINKPEGQVYKTSINILYGGPAQTLSSGNSANYVDTYAEYIIALVMLWAAMILPWLLLRIFRDYCCNLLAANNVTLNAIYEAIRQFPSPNGPPPTQPSPTAAIAATLPYRQTFMDKIRDVKTTQYETVRELSRTTTTDIARAMDMSVSRLSDVSKLELSDMKRSDVMSRLDKIASPDRIASVAEREQYQAIRSELMTRAASGDKMAQAMLVASERKQTALIQGVKTSIQGAYAPKTATKTVIESVREVMSSTSSTERVATETNTSSEKVREVLQAVASTNMVNTTTIQMVSKQTNLSESKVREIIEKSHTQSTSTSTSEITTASVPQVIAEAMGVDEKHVKAVLGSVPVSGKVTEETIRSISQKTGVKESEVREIISTTKSSVSTTGMTTEKSVAEKVGVSESAVKEITSQMSTSKELTNEQVTEIARKTGMTEEKVRETAQSVKSSEISSVNTEKLEKAVAEEVGVSEAAVKEVLATVPIAGEPTEQQVAELAQKTGISQEKVKQISKATQANVAEEVSMTNEVSKKTGVSQKKVKEVLAELPKDQKEQTKKIAEVALKTGVSEQKVKEIAQSSQPAISFEDYEEVKKMWNAHYRESPVPVSETIQNRKEWVTEEQKKLTNISNMLASSDQSIKQKGYEQVAEVLPFMLLGGFSEAEVQAYIRAKIEAAKQLQTELEIEERVKAEMAQKQKVEEDEDTLVSIKRKATQTATAAQSQSLAMDVPEEEKKSDVQNMPVSEDPGIKKDQE